MATYQALFWCICTLSQFWPHCFTRVSSYGQHIECLLVFNSQVLFLFSFFFYGIHHFFLLIQSVLIYFK